MTLRKIVTGVFGSKRDARHAIDRLVDAGFAREELSLVGASRERELGGAPQRASASKGAAVGGTAGLALGAIAGGALAMGSIAAPEIGLLASGAIVSALAGAGAGGALGTLLGALIGLGLGERDATRGRGPKSRIVVALETTADAASRAISILRGEGSDEVAAH